jgi:leader peptidase (prepilin peptidase)/N-methyltransferase
MNPALIIEFSIFILFMVPLIYYDIKEQRIPDKLVLPGIVVLFIVKILIYRTFSIWYVINPLAGFLFFWALWFFSKGKIGLGDAKLSAYIALALGLPAWLMSILLASIGGLLFALIRIAGGKMSVKDKIPFAPFLAFSAAIAYFAYEPLIQNLKRLNFLHF